ncbi:MAG: aconitate hydratase AcnA [Bacteroidetes bacterium]|jgi:aconitate hydratase|nr:aconitate hydratase AcnA [Bacteroidota bacterium]
MSNGASVRQKDPFGARDTFDTGAGAAYLYRLDTLKKQGYDIDRLPYSIRVLLEALLRECDGVAVTEADVERLASYDPKNPAEEEIPFMPARVLLQDFTGVPAVVDLAALRSAMARLGGNPDTINPQVPVHLIIDHSVQVDHFGIPDALQLNAEIEFKRNRERYEFLRWGQQAFENFSVVPPASGICHQVNLEYVARAVWTRPEDGLDVAYPDSLVGTDSHTTMINGLGVLGWGVGGIEAEAVMLGQPIYMLMPEVVGFRLTGELAEGATATDLVLTVTQTLREYGVVGRFVEFFGPGLDNMTVPDRATISNMSPEYGATMGFFPVDQKTLAYMRQTGRSEEQIELVERYTKEQGLFRTADSPTPEFLDVLELDLGDVVPSVAGPKRPQDRIQVPDLKKSYAESFTRPAGPKGFGRDAEDLKDTGTYEDDEGHELDLKHGDVVIAAITSCTNTSNPSVMIGAGLLAKKAVERGLEVPPYVKTSLAPGSKVVTDYLHDSGLLPYMDQLGFSLVGYGCTTCIGNSGPLPEPVEKAIKEGDLIVSGVLSGNRNFEGRIHALVQANYLASPPLVVAYALAGTVDIDLTSEPLGTDSAGNDVYLADLWPSADEIHDTIREAVTAEMFKKEYDGIETSNETWNQIKIPEGSIYAWDEASTYVQEPPFFIDLTPEVPEIQPIEGARVLVKAGDSTTTDHISPAGSIPPDGPAGQYLIERGVKPFQFNSYGSRRGNHEVMMRGTFANIRIKNQLVPGTEGGITKNFLKGGEVMPIYDAAMDYIENDVPLVVLGGKDYGMGSSRDWAAKGTILLGVKAVIVDSYERIHRSNLIGMGVLPLQYAEGENAKSLGLDGTETFDIPVDDNLEAGQTVTVTATKEDGTEITFETLCRLDTDIEVEYYRHGGILHYVLRDFLSSQAEEVTA